MFPFNMNYTLERMNGKPLPAGIRPTLVVSNELRGSGHSGCNRYSATTYPGYNGQMRIGPVALTRMACPGPAMAVESAYLRIYYSARRWREANDVLTIQGGLGTLVFRRGI